MKNNAFTNRSASHSAKHAGVSLIIAIVFTSAMLLVMAGLAEAIIKGAAARRNWKMYNRAVDLAVSAQELASEWTAANATGAAITLTAADADAAAAALASLAADLGIENCADTDPVAAGDQACVGFEVLGRNRRDTDAVKLGGVSFYSIPIRGTGDATGVANASPAENCVAPSASGYDAANTADDPCNWNRLYFRRPVEIPLYYGNADGTVTTFPAAIAGAFKLRIRAPACVGGEVGCNAPFTGTNGRMELYPRVADISVCGSCAFRNIYKDKILVQWVISDGDTILLARDSHTEIEPNILRPDPARSFPSGVFDNTELSAGRINDATNFSAQSTFILQDFTVLEKNQKGNILNRSERLIADFIASATRPVLRLTLIERPKRWRQEWTGASHNLTNDEINNPLLDVPYLEYQLLTNELEPSVSDIRSYIRAWSRLGNFGKEIITRSPERSSSASGFVLEH